MWVFAIKCIPNGKSYVGLTKNNVYGVRLGEILLEHKNHANYGLANSKLLKIASSNFNFALDLKKYGQDAFVCEVLDSDDRENIANVVFELNLWPISDVPIINWWPEEKSEEDENSSEDIRINTGVTLLSEDYIKYKKWFWIKFFMQKANGGCYNEILPDVDNLRSEIQQLRALDSVKYGWLS